MSSWIFSIPSEETETSLNECWKIALQNNPDIFGVFWSHNSGKCRGIIKTAGLLPWPSLFPDYQSKAKLCLLEDIAGRYTHSTNSNKSRELNINLCFHFHVRLLYSLIDIIGPAYETCLSSVKKTCNGKFEISPRGQKMDYDACKKYCNEDNNCKFFFHIPSLIDIQANCMKYFSCDETRVPAYSGSTYSKDSKCQGTYPAHFFSGKTYFIYL